LASLFEILALLGGNEALAALSSSAGGSNEEVKDAAIRALANWPDFTATKALLVMPPIRTPGASTTSWPSRPSPGW